MGLWQFWDRLLAAVAEAWVRQRVPGDSSTHDVVAVAVTAPAASDLERCASGSGETEERVAVVLVGEGEEISTPPRPTTAGGIGTTSSQNRWIQRGWAEIMVRQLQVHLLGVVRRAISAAQLHMVAICWMTEVSTEQSEDGRKHLKRLYEYTKKAMSFETLLLLALMSQQQQSLYYSNTAFKVSLAMLLVAFFTNLLTVVLLLNSFISFFPFFKYPIYISSNIQMLVPFGLLVSSGHLQPYMIVASPLPFFSIALFHRADTTDDASALDHIFDMSAGVYALLSAGCALTISSRESVSSPLACSLFVTILIARYLMLISTLRPPVIVEHAGTLMLILKLLLALTVIFVAVEFLGWRRAMLVIAVCGTDAALFFMFLLVSNAPPRADHQQHRKDQQLLSGVLVSVLFMALTQTYSEHAAAGGKEASALGSAAVLRLLLYFGAFLWSLNRMLITLGLGDDDVAAPAPAPPQGGHALLISRVWSALELIRVSVVVVAALDMTCKFGIALLA